MGAISITASVANYESQTKNLSVVADSNTVVDFNLIMPGEGSITGVVYAPGGITPQSAATVQALQDNTVIRSGKTAADGSYFLSMPPGNYVLKAVYGTTYVSALASVTVSAGNTTPQNLTLNIGGYLYGNTYKVDGTALAGVNIQVTQGSVIMGNGTSDNNGVWQISNLPAGAASVTASASGYTTQTKSATVNAYGSSRVDFSLATPSEGSIAGVVYQVGGTTPQSGATVRALQAGVVTGSTTTGPDGSYILALPTGSYDVRAVSGTYFVSGLASVTVSADNITAQNLTLGYGGSLYGNTYKVDGSVLAEVTIQVTQGGVIMGNGISDSKGYWRVNNVPVGSASVTATASGYTTQTKSTTVNAYGAYRVNFTVVDGESPTVPTDLIATAVSASEINLSWTASTDNIGVTGYIVYRDGVQVGTPTAISFSDSGLTSATTYSYTVAACDAAVNCSASSAPASAMTLDNVPPSVPTGLAGSAFSTTQINLTWTASTDNVGVTGYKVYRGGVEVGTSPGTSFSDTGLEPATSYSYTVEACDAAVNCSAQSTAISASTVDNIAPTTPAGLTATAVSKSQINLSWTVSTDSIGVVGYKIERCTGSKCTNFAQIATSTTNSFNNTGLAARTTYKYRVSAYDAVPNTSTPSSNASATTPR